MQVLSSVYLVSCVGKKRSSSAPAKHLYISDWFLKARQCVEKTGSPWFILSAEHGLLSPEDTVAPYDRTLNTMNMLERRAWASRVTAEMKTALPNADRIVILAGLRYREFLMAYLRQNAKTVEAPMEGLGIGKQLRYLTEALRHERL